MLKKALLRNRNIKLAKKKLRKNWICILYPHREVKMEDVTLVNNVTLCMNITRYDVAVWRGTMHKKLFAA